MPTIILTSSGQFVTGKIFDKYLPKKLQDCKIAFIITASKKARHLEYMVRHRARMNDLKWNYTEIDITGKTQKQLLKMLGGYDVIVMGGGNTFYLLKQIHKSGFTKVIKKLMAKGVVYIGTSAGAYVACPSIIISTWRQKEKSRFGVTNFKAMKMVPFWIKAHYTPDQLPLLKEKSSRLSAPLYILNDRQALVIQNKKIKFVGKGKEIILPGAKPKTIIVDENDKIIGYKDRDKIKRNDIYRVSALWIKNSKGDILLAQRSFNKKNDPGKWGPAVAGTIEEGETYESNIIKEAEEEIGLKNIKMAKGPKTRRTGEHNYFRQLFFAIVNKPTSKFKIQKEELEAIKWFKKEKLLKELEMHPENFLQSIKHHVETFK